MAGASLPAGTDGDLRCGLRSFSRGSSESMLADPDPRGNLNYNAGQELNNGKYSELHQV
jgi:hypothetical protein